MNTIFNGTKTLAFLAILILWSCATTTNKVACPSFDTGKVAKSKKNKNGTSRFNVREAFSFKKGCKAKRKCKKMSNPNFIDDPFTDLDAVELDLFALNETENLLTIEPIITVYTYAQNQDEDYEMLAKNDAKVQKSRKVIKTNMNTSSQTPKNVSVNSKKKIEVDNPNRAERKTARIIGGALLLMAVLAGIAIPALGTLTASLGLISIFLLDILVSFGIYKYHKKKKPTLAKTSGILRLLYTAILGVAIGYHVMGNVPMFNNIWGIGLIVFGIHLITLGILFNNEDGKKWVSIMIKSLLIIAGIGYIIQYIGMLVVPNPVGFVVLIESIFIIPMILGEVFYALWMLIKGGKLRKSEI